MYVVEKYTLDAVHREPRRALLMLPATLVTHTIWDARVDDTVDYNALERAAREGFFASTLDWEGSGRSSLPESGFDVTAERLIEDAGDVLEWIHRRRDVPRIDIFGSSLGSAIAVGLASDVGGQPSSHVGRLVLTAHVYKNASDFGNATIFSPGVHDLLRHAPNGYVDTEPFHYGWIVSSATPEAQGYCFGTCPGRYAAGPTLEGFELPVF